MILRCREHCDNTMEGAPVDVERAVTTPVELVFLSCLHIKSLVY